jgi:hypothetical protein
MQHPGPDRARIPSLLAQGGQQAELSPATTRGGPPGCSVTGPSGLKRAHRHLRITGIILMSASAHRQIRTNSVHQVPAPHAPDEDRWQAASRPDLVVMRCLALDVPGNRVS